MGFIDAVLSVTHRLAVADDGTLYPFGTLAIPELNPKPKSIVPTGLSVDKDLANNGHCVAAGGGFCVVIDKNKSLCQWTVVEIGMTKTYKTTEILVPAGKFKKVAARNDYVIAISEEGDLYGWGPPLDAMWDAPVPFLTSTTFGVSWEIRTSISRQATCGGYQLFLDHLSLTETVFGILFRISWRSPKAALYMASEPQSGT